MSIDLIKDMAEAVKATVRQQERTTAYDTPATVRRIEGGTAWVHIPGGVDETPVKLTISCKPGDTVQIRVGGGSAWLVGNATAPPTDDTRAKRAEQAAKAAAGVATDFVTDTKDGIFVHPKDNTADGVRITDAIEILRGGISYIRAYVEDSLARVRVGRADAGHSVIDSGGMRIYGGDGTTLLANIGYGEGNAEVGTEVEPYYSFGDRVGIPGNYSVAEGSAPEASGIASHAEGDQCAATAQGAHSEGVQTEASAVAAHSEGETCTASGRASHAEGSGTSATHMGDHSEGVDTTASGGYGAHAEGYDNTASGPYSHAGGVGNTAAQEAQTVIGKYAPAATSLTDDLFVVGNGTSASARSYAMRLKKNGRAEFAGAVGSGLSWDTRSEMVTAMADLLLYRPYQFYAGATWANTAGAGSHTAFGTICKMTTTSWHLMFMCGGSVYKSVFDNSQNPPTFSTTLIG